MLPVWAKLKIKLRNRTVRLLIRALRLARTPDLEIVTTPVFRLLAVDATEVIGALGELNAQGELRFRMQADVIELEIERPA